MAMTKWECEVTFMSIEKYMFKEHERTKEHAGCLCVNSCDFILNNLSAVAHGDLSLRFLAEN